MSEAKLIGSAKVNPAPARNETGSKLAPGAGEPATDRVTVPGDLAVQLTQEEWDEQDRLLGEYISCIMKDKKRAAEIRPKIIWPAWLLKATKKSMGATYIRMKGYNTTDADLVYGPGWLDEDDGGPESIYAPDYKPTGWRKWAMERK